MDWGLAFCISNQLPGWWCCRSEGHSFCRRRWCARKPQYIRELRPSVCIWDAKNSSSQGGRGGRRGWDCLGRESHTCLSALHLELPWCAYSHRQPTSTAEHLLLQRTNINLKHENTYPLNTTCFCKQITFLWPILYLDYFSLFNILCCWLHKKHYHSPSRPCDLKDYWTAPGQEFT